MSRRNSLWCLLNVHGVAMAEERQYLALCATCSVSDASGNCKLVQHVADKGHGYMSGAYLVLLVGLCMFRMA